MRFSSRAPLTALVALLGCASALSAQVRKPAPTAQAKAQPERPPEPLADTAIAEFPETFTGARFDAVLRHLATPGVATGYFAIRLPADSLCDEHPLRVRYDAGTERLSVMLDGGHSWNTPGIELFCGRRMTGVDATGPKGERFRATRIVERGQFVVPDQSDLRWQSHFQLALSVPKGEGVPLERRLTYYLIVLPSTAAAPAESDSTREAATPDRPDELISVQGRLRVAGAWLWIVDRTTRKVLGKGPLLPGLCPDGD
jgi:hypothetical protein